MSEIKMELIQDKYTNFILYDGTERCKPGDYIALADIEHIDIVFKDTSSDLETNHLFRLNSDQKGIVLEYGAFESVDCTCYECVKTLSLEVDGVSQVFECNTNITTVGEMVNMLNAQNTTLDMIFILGPIGIRGVTTNAGEEHYIKVIGGDLLKYLKWNIGIYKGNDINWGATLAQKELYFYYNIEDLGFSKEIPEGYFDVQIITEYNHGEIYVQDYTEFTYKQTEIYRAMIFEYIANRFEELIKVEQRYQTEFELFMQKSVYFDSMFKAFLASIEVGNEYRSYELLKYLIDYKTLNPIL